jgi:hypothetical protein
MAQFVIEVSALPGGACLEANRHNKTIRILAKMSGRTQQLDRDAIWLQELLCRTA